MILVTPGGQRYILLIGDTIIGRSAGCDLRLRHSALSRHHAIVRWDGERATITDLGSTNGTILNGQRLVAGKAYPLRVGDLLELAGAEGQLEVSAAGRPEVALAIDAQGLAEYPSQDRVFDQDTHPYVGPRAFQRGEKLYGRHHEILELLDLLIAERILLLYSPSGAGKTSLIQAALIPELEREGFHVLPAMRVSLTAPRSLSPGANRYVPSLLLSLEETLAQGRQIPLEELASMTLADYLDRRDAASGDPDSLVLIFDQFEEILTVDPTDRVAKAEFFEQVGQALRDRRRWALFAMREEFVAGLDPYLRALPTRLSTTYRLELLAPAAAQEAIQQPPRQLGVEFTDAAALKLVDDLRQERVQRADGSTEVKLGQSIEPVQLQVVCRRLWDRLPPGASQIVAQDLEAVGDVDTALAGYYAERVAAIAAQSGIPERSIRDWVDRRLITEQGIRGQVLQGLEQSQGLDNRAIWPLVDAHLVRAEKRRGATWFELAHDRLIEPIQSDNVAWREAHLNPLQRQANLWSQQGRPSGLLLRDQSLATAEAWASANAGEMTPVEHDFLGECRRAQERMERERQQARRIRWLAVGVVFGVIAIILAVFASSQWRLAERGRLQAVLSAQQAATAKAGAEASLHVAETAEAVAEELREQAEQRQRRLEQSRASLALAAASTTTADPALAVLLAVEAIYQTHLAQPGVMTDEAVTAAHRAIGRSRWLATLGYHRRDVVHAEWSPDDARIVTAGEDGMAVVWDAATGQEIAALIGHGCNEYGFCKLYDAAWSPAGSRIVTTGLDGTARVWDAASGTEIVTFRRHGCDSIGQCEVTDAAWNRDGQRVATAGADTTARVWDPETGEELLVLSGHRNTVNRVAWSPDGQRILTASIDGDTKVWDATTGAELLALSGQVGMIEDARWSPDGTLIATAGSDGGGEVWDATTGEQLSRLQGHADNLTSIAWSPDGTHLVTTSWDGTAKVWDTATGTEVMTLRGHTNWLWHAAWSPDGTQLLTTSSDSTARVWDATTGAEVFAVTGCSSWSYHASWSSDGARVVATCGQGATVWDAVKTEDPFTLHGHVGSVESAAWSPDGSRIATASMDNTARVWDAATGAELLTLSEHDDWVLWVAWSSNGKWIATASDDRTAKVWDADTGEMVANATGHAGRIVHVAWSPDDTRILTASWDDTAKIWDLRTFEVITLEGHTDSVNGASWSPDGTRVVTSSWDNTARVWDAATGVELLTLSGHTGWVTSAVWSPDGSQIVTVSDAVARVWDSSTGAEVLTLQDPSGWAERAAWSPDGARILTEDGMWDAATGAQLFTISGRVSASAWRPDGKQIVTTGSESATVWDAATGAELFTLTGHLELVQHAAWSPDGTRIVTASADGTSRIFITEIDGPGGLVESACARTGRNLTYWEWGKYVSEELYQTTCANLLPDYYAARDLLDDAKALAEAQDLDRAEAFAQHALQLAMAAEEPQWSNSACWFGSIDGFADIVLPACEQAIELADEAQVPMYRDSRGLARALVGDYPGAIEDFRAFVEWSQTNDVYEELAIKREAWIADLEAGRNPFDEETLEALRDE